MHWSCRYFSCLLRNTKMRFDVDTFPTQGRHLIEASAGTGKTHNLMQLAIKMLRNEGVQAEELVLMTFTRASTRELRARLREELTTAIHRPNNPVQQSRIQGAIRHLNQVTILTIHGFAMQVLRDLGPSVGIHPRPMNEQTDTLLLDAALDVYRELARKAPTAIFQATLGSAKDFAKQSQLITNRAPVWIPDGNVRPNLVAVTEEHQVRAEALRSTIDQLKQTKGTQSRTIEKHCDNAMNALFPEAIPSDAIRYFKSKVSDEPLFQQWIELAQPTESQIAYRAYALKQVAWRFESLLATQGEMHPDQIIVQAAQVALALDPELRPGHRVILVDEFQDTDRLQWTLLDQLYPDIADRLLVLVGDPKQAIYRFRGADTQFYYQIRDTLPAPNLWTLDTNFRATNTVVQGLNQLYDAAYPVGRDLECIQMHTGKKDLASLFLDEAPLAGFQWCPSLEPTEVAELAADLIDRGRNHQLKIGDQPVKAGAIGVLVDSWQTAAAIQHAGRSLGVSFHYADQRSVFADPLSREMVQILDAIANPDDTGATSSAAATQLIGLRLDGSGTLHEHPDFAAFQADLLAAREAWYREGPAASLALLLSQYRSQERQPHDLSGVTSWMALAQSLEVFGETAKGLNPFEAARWWAHQATDESKALDSEKPRAPNRDDVVTITTIHGAKGLQYPIVIVAGNLKVKSIKAKDFAQSYCADQGLVLDFRPEGHQRATADLAHDAHRLTYVALTRSIHAVFLAEPTDASAVAPIFAGRTIDSLGPDHERFIVSKLTNPIQATPITTKQTHSLKRPHPPTWFVRSYSSLIRDQHDPGQPTRATDEVDLALEPNADAAGWHRIPGGTATGNFIHAVLEQSARQPTGEVITPYIESHWPSHLEQHYEADIHQWVDAIRAVVLPGGLALSELTRQQLRPEPQFQLPLAPGLRLDTLLKSFQAFSWWDDPIEGSGLQLNGQLTGFIDLVYEANGRFYLLDYKTNQLGDRGGHYTDASIAQAMRASHYQTQAAIYALALHRWLEQRLPTYDPNLHLGEVVYLFARGIDGPVNGLWSKPIEPDSTQSIAARCLHASPN
jgi:exodeoxyribonuclease V beta subunit